MTITMTLLPLALVGVPVENLPLLIPQFLPCRWVVERLLAWLDHYRRLSKDYELLPATSKLAQVRRGERGEDASRPLLLATAFRLVVTVLARTPVALARR